MRTFKDRSGREWTVDLNITEAKRAKSMLKVDILDLMDEAKGTELLARLQGDEIFVVDLVYVLVKDQADKLGLTDEDFGRSMAGGAIDEAHKVLLAEICDFFRNPARRAVLRTMMAKFADLEARGIRIAETVLANANPERIAEAMTIPGGPSGNSPESSASTPVLRSCANCRSWPRRGCASNGTRRANCSASSTTSTATPRNAPGHSRRRIFIRWSAARRRRNRTASRWPRPASGY